MCRELHYIWTFISLNLKLVRIPATCATVALSKKFILRYYKCNAFWGHYFKDFILGTTINIDSVLVW